MHKDKILSKEFQNTQSHEFSYYDVSISCKETNYTKIISFNTSHSFLMFKFTDVL